MKGLGTYAGSMLLLLAAGGGLHRDRLAQHVPHRRGLLPLVLGSGPHLHLHPARRARVPVQVKATCTSDYSPMARSESKERVVFYNSSRLGR